jgi:pteridine reductase
MHGKVILVTGGAKRVGAAISRRLHAAGANIALHYRSSISEAQALEGKLNYIRPGSAKLVQADLLRFESLPQLVHETVRFFGRLDAVINNASSFFPTPLAEVSEHQWDDLIGTNLKAPLFLAQAAAFELRQNNGAIINIVDIHAERPMHDHLVYSVAKAGLAALTRGLAVELAPRVRVNAVAPGVIVWPENTSWENSVRRKQIIDQTLLKRVGDPDDVAKTVFFLLQDAPYITGQIINVDGGKSINQ